MADWGSAAPGGSRRPDLPWRATRDPWSVLVSEVMAQQTQLTRVVPAYRAFLERFPDPATCAAAPLGDVLTAWRGLGYNRRARALHATAGIVAHDLGGRFPETLAGLRALPGIGPYTARAVLAFAFEADTGVVDTNAGRVVARAAAGRALSAAEAQVTVDAMVPSGRAWAFNQAMLDLGATVCLPAAPGCSRCPVRHRCVWRRAGGRGSLPDPAAGSAGAPGRQSRFEGSDRQGRGRLVDVLRRGPLPPAGVAAACGWPDDGRRVRRVLDGLVADGLVVEDAGGWVRLP